MSNSYRAWLPHDFETHQEAVKRRDKLITTLTRSTGDDKALAKNLRRCKKERRCQIEACPICMRHFRIWLLREGQMVLEEGRRRRWYACTIVPAGLRVPPGELASFDPKKYVKKVQRKLRYSRLKGALVIGGIDFSFNTKNNKDLHWQPHLYLLISTGRSRKSKEQIRRGLERVFEWEPTADKPYNSKRVYSPRGALSYAYKALFGRRSGYRANGRANTRDLPLKSPEQREIASFLSGYRPGDRLILRGMRRDGKRLRLLACRRDS